MKFFSFVLFSIFLSESYAQTPSVKWWYDVNDSSFGQSCAGDIDGDGQYEVVFGCYRNDSCVYALNAENGTLLWKYNAHVMGAEGCNDVAPLIFDVDNDGNPEVIVPSSCNPKTFCFNGSTGSVKWETPTRGSDSPPTIADLDNDGIPEILHGEFGGYVICINAETGAQKWEIQVAANSWVQTAPTILDLNNDGQLDFVVGTWHFNGLDSIYAYRGDNHTLLWTYPVHDYMYHGTAIADLDKDGKPELVIGSYNDTLYCINGENGTTRWKIFGGGGYIGAPATIGDIDNDGNCEVFFVSGYKVTCLSNSGAHKWTYNIPSYAGAFRGVVLADINSNSTKDVIFGTGNGRVISLNGDNGSLIWSIDMADFFGDPDFEFDHAPLVADFDNDDTLDIFIVGGRTEYPNFNSNYGKACMISAGKGNGPEWLMFQRDIRRQSSLCDFTTNLPEEKAGTNTLTLFPNPVSESFDLSFPYTPSATLFLYNITGELLMTIPGISGSELKVSRGKLEKGMYFIQMTDYSGKSENIKFIVE